MVCIHADACMCMYSRPAGGWLHVLFIEREAVLQAVTLLCASRAAATGDMPPPAAANMHATAQNGVSTATCSMLAWVLTLGCNIVYRSWSKVTCAASASNAAASTSWPLLTAPAGTFLSAWLCPQNSTSGHHSGYNNAAACTRQAALRLPACAGAAALGWRRTMRGNGSAGRRRAATGGARAMMLQPTATRAGRIGSRWQFRRRSRTIRRCCLTAMPQRLPTRRGPPSQRCLACRARRRSCRSSHPGRYAACGLGWTSAAAVVHLHIQPPGPALPIAWSLQQRAVAMNLAQACPSSQTYKPLYVACRTVQPPCRY